MLRSAARTVMADPCRVAGQSSQVQIPGRDAGDGGHGGGPAPPPTLGPGATTA